MNMHLYLLSDGHTDSDILMKWRNPKIEIGNKEMAQFSVGEAVLTTQVNKYSTGKIIPLLFAKANAATPNSKLKTVWHVVIGKLGIVCFARDYSEDRQWSQTCLSLSLKCPSGVVCKFRFLSLTQYIPSPQW